MDSQHWLVPERLQGYPTPPRGGGGGGGGKQGWEGLPDEQPALAALLGPSGTEQRALAVPLRTGRPTGMLYPRKNKNS